MSFCSPCCSKWCNDGEEKRHSEVLYQKVKDQKVDDEKESDIDVILPQYETVPLQKIFEFQQPLPQCPLPVHHPICRDESQCVIDQQPNFMSYISDTIEKVDEPMIHFSLYYDFQRCTLTVNLFSGSNFMSRQIRNRTHPNSFVIVFLIPNREQIFESKVSKRSNNPIFEDVFEFNGLSSIEVRRQTLIFRVIDKTKSTNDDVGIIALPLQDADLYGIKMSMKLTQDRSILNSDCNGDILISLVYEPFAHFVTGMLLKATNLKKIDKSGSTDPYVKINLYQKDNRVYKWKSSIKKGTVIPVYNEKFEFDILGMDIRSVRLEVVVAGHDVVGMSDIIGVIQIGEGSEHPTGRLQWTEMISSPRNPTCFWHTIPKPMKPRRLTIIRTSSIKRDQAKK